MSAMGKLIGVECAQCRRKGHHCQAQMLAALTIHDEPLCLRCADGEPCCYETAQKMEMPEWLRERFDPCEIPPTSREDREMLARTRQEEHDGREAEKASVVADLETMSCKEVAEKYGLRINVVLGLRLATDRAKQLRGEGAACYSQNYELRRRALKALRIEGENVRMAPCAVMGAEMLGLRKCGCGHPKKLRPCPICGVPFGCEDLRFHLSRCKKSRIHLHVN
jgi:hypothetical protein